MIPRLSIVVVSFNTSDLLRECLASVVDNPNHSLETQRLFRAGDDPAVERTADQASPAPASPLSCEVIVVDNASTDGSADMVEAEFPGVRSIRSERNLGFARATNIGLELSRGELLLLLNPDTRVLGDALVLMSEFLESHPAAGCAGPSLVYQDGRPQHAAFHLPNLWMSFLDFFPLNHRFLNSSLNGRYSMPADGEPFEVGHPLGAAMMIRRDALEHVGVLDERFFMYCEEVDWCIRAWKAGWGVFQVPRAKIVHHSGQSSAQFREAMLVELHRSRYILFKKHYSPAFVHAHRTITRAGLEKETLRSRVLAMQGKISHAELLARLRAYKAIWDM